MAEKRFVIRVYAIITNERNEVLLSDEYVKNTYMTKFPGGGLEWGEGTIDCLKREALEEFGQAIEVLQHFYTTDYFQKALFYEESQLMSRITSKSWWRKNKLESLDRIKFIHGFKERSD